MIIKPWGESGDERIPPAFRGDEFTVIGKCGDIGWILIAINEESGQKSWSYPANTHNGIQLGHLISREFDRKLIIKTNFSGKITDLSEYEIDNMLDQAYALVISHYTGIWTIVFMKNGNFKDTRIIKGLMEGLKAKLRWLLPDKLVFDILVLRAEYKIDNAE